MASNLSTIGFVFDTEDAFTQTMTGLAAETSHAMTCPQGECALWRSRTGAELWFHLADAEGEEGREIVGLTPFFEGKSEVAMGLTAIVRRPGDNAFEGAFHAWVAPDEETGTGSYPLVFDAVDFAVHADRELPAVCTARLVGFTRELKAHASEADFYAGQQADAAPIAAQSFFPLGLFAAGASEEGEELAPPSSTALINGRIIEHRPLVNEATGRAFHWLLVETLDATLDVVADPEIVEGEIVVGGIVEAACMLFGRILSVAEPVQPARH